MNKILAAFLWILGTSVFSQIAPDVYLVNFADKQNSPFSIDLPQDFLSQRSINRRTRFQISITEQDLPVNPSYIQGVRNFVPSILTVSKWFNSVSINTNNPESLDSIRSLPYVRSIKSTCTSQGIPVYPDKLNISAVKASNIQASLPDTSYYNYGQGSHQIGMIKGHILHNQGYQGQGMVIAVLDGGFTGADNNPAFDSLWKNHQILGTWDFIKNTPVSFHEHPHGAWVLSIMAANLPGQMVGTAPKAGYYLLRTEYGPTEYLLEEDYWISGAEYADSVGADLINSSISYTTFDDSTMNHTYQDMDGNTTRITKAADIAASKGILVVTSAGNKGDSPWRYIGAPADADSVLTVGAVDAERIYASFSSIGPTINGRVKPNLAAQGDGTAFVATDGNIYTGNGTSFSSPLICGLAACLWQSNRSVNNYDLIQLMQETGSQALNPDFYLGYGLPDFSKAFFDVQGIEIDNIQENSLLRIFPNPFYSSFTIDYYAPKPEPLVLEIWDLTGRLVYREEHDPGYNSFQRIKISGLENLNPGIFITRITTSQSVTQARIMKQRTRQ